MANEILEGIFVEPVLSAYRTLPFVSAATDVAYADHANPDIYANPAEYKREYIRKVAIKGVLRAALPIAERGFQLHKDMTKAKKLGVHIPDIVHYGVPGIAFTADTVGLIFSLAAGNIGGILIRRGITEFAGHWGFGIIERRIRAHYQMPAPTV